MQQTKPQRRSTTDTAFGYRREISTDASRDAIRRLAKEGKYPSEIAAELGMSKSAVAAAAKKYGITLLKGMRPAPAKPWEIEACKLRRQGLSLAKIADTLGMNRNTVTSMLARVDNGLKPDPLA